MITGYLEADQGTDRGMQAITVKHQFIDTKKKIGYLPEANPFIMKCM